MGEFIEEVRGNLLSLPRHRARRQIKDAELRDKALVRFNIGLPQIINNSIYASSFHHRVVLKIFAGFSPNSKDIAHRPERHFSGDLPEFRLTLPHRGDSLSNDMEISRKDLRAKAQAAIEWPRLLERLAERAMSPRGKEACKSMRLAASVAGARRLLDETAELIELIRQGGSVPLGHFEDILDLALRCEKGAIVKPEELRDISSMLDLARLARGFFKNFREQTPLLWERAQPIEELTDLKLAIDRVIDDSGRIKENATPELKRLLQSLRDQRTATISRLEEFMRHEENEPALQDTYFTQRGNRYVLPVKSESRHKMEGIVHDSSQSGQTLFIEPRQFIELNNRLKMADLEIEQEIERIVRELVSKVAYAADKLRMDLEILTELDVIYARARLARDLNASNPAINDLGVVKLKNIRHPHLVLQRIDVVPNDIEIDADLDAIIISGPNTGGKTVMLKTVGLFALMIRAGMLIPAEPGGEMAFFNDVWADIGDEQNIEEHLSTFSGHIMNIIGILNSVHHGSLVLLDELVTSTNPMEGSALAEAILHQLVARGAKTITTTHYTQLKAYAEVHPGFQNAGVEFDNVSLKPTYRFIQGIPGRSSALEIASRLGMDREVTDRAREFLDTSEERVEELLTSLEKQAARLVAERREAKETLEKAKELKREQQQLRNKLKEEEREFRRAVRTKIAGEIGSVRDEIKDLLVVVRREKSGKAASDVQNKLRQIEKRYNEVVEDVGEPVDPKTLKEGDTVTIAHLGVTGVLLDDPAGKNKVKVQVGQASIVTPIENLRAAMQTSANDKKIETVDWGAVHRRKIDDVEAQGSASITRLDLRGFRTEDALIEVERFLDRASLSGVSQVEIIHGHGTGALKKYIRDLLRKSQYSKSWNPAALERGGDGVTIVELNIRS